MAAKDVHKLDHNTLEAMGIRAFEKLQSEQSLRIVIKDLGFSRGCKHDWLAVYRTYRWRALRAKPLKYSIDVPKGGTNRDQDHRC